MRWTIYERFYAPNNATLVIAGDVEPETVKALAEKHYGPLRPPTASPRGTARRNRRSWPRRRLTLADERVSDPYVFRTYLAPERDPGAQAEAAALTVLAELLGGSGQTSVLARALQFDTQTAVYTSAFYSGTSIDDATFGPCRVPGPGVFRWPMPKPSLTRAGRFPDATAPTPPRWSGSAPRSALARSTPATTSRKALPAAMAKGFASG
jgi:hypothetical protein